MRERKPWTIHPDLTHERLIEVARLIRMGRNNALDRYDAEIGDDSWTLGCRAFQFQRHELLLASIQERFPWLSVIDASRQFVFRIGAVPIRFYRGLAEEPNERTLQKAYPELQQLSLFPATSEARVYTHRLAIETDLDGGISAIKYVAMSGDTPAYCWDIPLDAAIAPIRPIGGEPAAGVQLPAPGVFFGDEDEDQAQGKIQ